MEKRNHAKTKTKTKDIFKKNLKEHGSADEPNTQMEVAPLEDRQMPIKVKSVIYLLSLSTLFTIFQRTITDSFWDLN